MFFVKIVNLLRGYVIIVIEGAFPERFLNICARRGIYLWDVRRTGLMTICANVSVRGFRLMRPIAKKSRCTVTIKERIGAPFYVHRHRRRKAFAAGVILFGLILLALTRFIWVIEITGNERVETSRIAAALEQSGLRAGMRISQVDVRQVQSAVMIAEGDIAWLGINIKGTKAYVDVKERVDAPAVFPFDKPCGIYAVRDAVIDSIDATNGERLVAPGDVVKTGELLISGAIGSNVLPGGIRYVHADGEVVGRTWYEIEEQIPQFRQVRTPTGRTKSKHVLKVFNFLIKFFIKDSISYPEYDRISDVKRFSIGSDMYLPMTFHYDKYLEVTISDVPLEQQEAEKIAEERAFEKVKGHNILSVQKEITADNIMKITYECLESIGEKRSILKEDTKDNGESDNDGGRNN